MSYSIGEVARAAGVSVSTLRYYDREGMFPGIERSGGGIRVFSDREVGALRVIECLKASGMAIKDIKTFLDWCQEGDASLKKRRDMFYERLEEVKKQMAALQQTMNMIKFKCWYYDTALAEGAEEKVRAMPAEDIPAELQEYRL